MKEKLVAFLGERLGERFASRVEIYGRSECWPWTGGKDSHGYGQFSTGRSMVKTHRVVFEACYGHKPGRLHHRCDNAACANPTHLWEERSHDS